MRRLARLCVTCGRSTPHGVRLVGDRDALIRRLRALGVPEGRATSLVRPAGPDRRTLSVAVCRSCARGRRVKVGELPTTAGGI